MLFIGLQLTVRMFFEESADHTDLACGEEERNSAPSGTLTAQNFIPPDTFQEKPEI